MLRKLPAALSGSHFAQTQTQAGGGQEHYYALSAGDAALFNLPEILA